MKSFLFIGLTLLTTAVFAQPKVYKQAVISTTTNVIAPEDEGMDNMQGGGDMGGRMSFRNMMDGETKFVTYLKGDKIKTTIKSEMGKSAIYRDNSQKTTTTVIEMMGSKNGFFTTDEEQADMQKRRDSMMALRRSKDSSGRSFSNNDRNNVTTDISYTEESKNIAGFKCKKAYLITTRILGIKDSSVIWYTPEFKLDNVSYTGSLNNMPMMGNMAPTLNGLDKINGFVMAYETKMRRNRLVQVEVTKVELEKAIDDKEFEISKDIEIKPMKEMQMMFRGGGNGGFRGGRD